MDVSITISDAGDSGIATTPGAPVTSAATPSGGGAAAAESAGPAAGGGEDVPADLLARAAAVGAISAGPAPTGPPGTGTGPLGPATTAAEGPGPGGADLSAGPAAAVAAETVEVVVADEGENGGTDDEIEDEQ